MTDVVNTKEYHAHMKVNCYLRNQLRERVTKLEERLDSMNVAFGVACNPTYFSNTRISDDPNYIPVDDDGVWNVSSTTMNLLYAMYQWADKNGINHEDDWENHLKIMRNHLDMAHIVERETDALGEG
tara:strand:- start:212 stop:592 length:381 start_codon:yes stop_codon:yes gene_type:complete